MTSSRSIHLHANSTTYASGSLPPVAVKGGQLVRIRGWVNVPQTIAANQDDLTITDSMTGEELPERIPVTHGGQEFKLYRSVSANTNLKVTFSLTGLGQAMLDEVTVRAIDPPPIQREARQASNRLSVILSISTIASV